MIIKMTNMKIAFAAPLVVSLLASVSSPAQESATEYVLVKGGQPRAAIILSERPTQSAQLGALELRHHVKLITGAELPVLNDPGIFDGLKLFVGWSEAVKKLGITANGFKSQEYTVKFLPGAIVLAGRDKPNFDPAAYDAENPIAAKLPSPWDEIGTLYAVHDFLRDCCGVRWLNPTEVGTVHPSSQDLVVSGKDVRRQPFMSYRAMTSVNETNYGRYDRVNLLWLEKSSGFKEWEELAYTTLHSKYPAPKDYSRAKERLLQLFILRARYGGVWLQGNHSLYGYYNRFWERNPGCPEAFEATRRDWFAKGYAPRSKPDQMCYSNQELVEQVVKDARDYFDGKARHPFSGKPTPGEYFWGKDYFSVTPMDNTNYCKCPECQKQLCGSPEKNYEGYATPLHFTFINHVAKEVKKTHPDKWIYCTAYAANLKPPDFPLEDNVTIRFCFSANRGAPFDSKTYKAQVELLKEWHEKLKGQNNQLFLVLYYCFPLESAQNGNWHCFPGFFARTLGTQFKLFKECGIRGVNHCGYGQDVESYVTFSLMDNPDLDVSALLDDYFGMFGAAGKPLQEMYNMIETAYADPANYPSDDCGQTAEIAWTRIGTAERMEKMGSLMAEAEKLADTPLLKRRVELWKKSIWDYMISGRKKYLLTETANKCLKAKEYATAVVNFEQLLGMPTDSDGERYMCLLKLGQCLMCLKKYPEATKKFIDAAEMKNCSDSRAGTRDPVRRMRAFIGAGQAAREAKLYPESLALFDKAMAVADPSGKPKIQDDIATTLWRQGNPDKAVAIYQELLGDKQATDSDKADYFARLAKIHASTKEADKEIDCYESIKRLSPNNCWARKKLGDIYLQRKENGKAAENFLEALNTKGKDGYHRGYSAYQLANMELASGDNAAAAEHLKMAVELGDKAFYVNDARKKLESLGR